MRQFGNSDAILVMCLSFVVPARLTCLINPRCAGSLIIGGIAVVHRNWAALTVATRMRLSCFRLRKVYKAPAGRCLAQCDNGAVELEADIQVRAGQQHSVKQ